MIAAVPATSHHKLEWHGRSGATSLSRLENKD
jgi:hypothetical protein